MVDGSGLLLGIVVSKSADNEGIGFATSTAEVEAFLRGAEPAVQQPANKSDSRGVTNGFGASIWLVAATAFVLVAAASVLLAMRHRRSLASATTEPVRLPPLDLTNSDLGPSSEKETRWTP